MDRTKPSGGFKAMMPTGRLRVALQNSSRRWREPFSQIRIPQGVFQ